MKETLDFFYFLMYGSLLYNNTWVVELGVFCIALCEYVVGVGSGYQTRNE